MPKNVFSGSISSPRIDVAIDMGNPFLNRTVDGFLKIGTVAASRVAAEETFHFMQKGSISKGKLEDALKRMCKEGAYWGTVAGVYVGVEYGMERVRGTKDWWIDAEVFYIYGNVYLFDEVDGQKPTTIFISKNAMIGGALTGLLISAAGNNNRDKVFKDAITAGAIATAAEFINYLT